ncbi:spermidine/putrescine ABC transporter permease [Spiroplasma gladiatoris]|uniref:Spermidine/putrescine ABC transporter permease n=1 Tax=Spiroplasma gladiatoris TaxID=2143 RepID=A0A4P7AGT9_9MOLU|nr:spermidine/putrescine ABC transporter permease/substrate-binding protein [Spiroplasma gladiatoris]QBQ07357.1 spermidine/putrescine ABC transporter permease [Spiroplasma gladiatoris]
MKKLFKSSYFALILLFIYIPIFVMILFSFNSGNSVSEWNGFSSKWYKTFLENSPFVKSIIVSLFVAVVSTIISIVIGVMAVIGLSKMKIKTSNRWVRIANIPLVNADVITAVGLMLFFIFAGLKFGIFSLICAHVSFNVPYVIITVLPFMNRIDKNLIDASKDLGAAGTKTVRKIVLPILLPSIITATAICFAMSFDDFIISYFTGGDQTNVSTFIYTAKRMQPYINVFGVFLVLVTVLVVLLWNGYQIINNKAKTNKELIKKGDYKIKMRNALQNKINILQASIETELKTRKSKSVVKWTKFKILDLHLKIKRNRSFNSKISKLEWKVALLNEEIAESKRLTTIITKLNEKKLQLQSKIEKINNIKKSEKLQAVIYKIDKKLDKYQKEVDWIKERELADKQKAIEIGNEINVLNKEFLVLTQEDKDYQWYKDKINSLTKKQQELNEGRNIAKLRETIQKLQSMKEKSVESIEKTYQEWLAQKKLVLKQVSIVESLDKKLNNLKIANASDEQINNLVALRNQKVSEVKELYSAKIQKLQTKLNSLNDELNKKREKYFPDVTAEGYVSKRASWFQRSWKRLGLGVLLVGSFGLLTTAYIKNNVYDLVIGNWGSYIDPTLITDFEKENNVKINYQQFDSNETLYNKTYTFSYDMMVPSDYMVKKLAQENKLQKLDWCKIDVLQTPKNVQGLPNSCPKDQRTDFDENFDKIDDTLVEVLNKTVIAPDDTPILNYGIPWIWGDVRMVWNLNNDKVVELLKNKNIYDQDEQKEGQENLVTHEENLSWGLLWEAANAGMDVKVNSDPKNVFMFAFEKLFGQIMAMPPSEENGKLSKQEQIDKAEVEVKSLVSHKNVGLYGDEIVDKIAKGDFDVAVVYNGDALYSHTSDYESETEDGEEDQEEPNSEESDGNESTSDDLKITHKIDGGNPDLNSISLIPGGLAEDKVSEEKGVRQSTNIWSDNLVLSADNRNLDLSYKFINFIFTRESQERIVEETASSTPLSYLIENPPYEGELAKWFKPTNKGEPFDLDKVWDNYMVDKFNNIIATKN